MDVTQGRGGDRDRRQPDRRTTRWRRPGSRTRSSNGTKLIVLRPAPHRPGAPSRTAFLQFKPDTDVALLNAMMHVIVAEGLVDEAFIAERTDGYEALAQERRRLHARRRWRRSAASPPRPSARSRGCTPRRKASMILWGMGISQHVHGTDNARCLIALALMTGQIGRPGTGLHPLRGQNNVQGASDAGLIPMMYPDYQRVDNAEARARFEQAWGVPPARSTPAPGLTVVEVMHAIKHGEIRGMYVHGREPGDVATPTPTTRARRWPRSSMLVVQDIFLTETAYLADVVLPATAFAEKTGSFTNTDRLVQLGRQALDAAGRGAARTCGSSSRSRSGSACAWHYGACRREVFDEMRHTHAQHRRHHLGAAGARACASPTPARTKATRASRWSSSTTSRTARRQGALRAGRHHPGRRAARRRLPDGADHRPPARALAHRQHDAPRQRARRDRARPGGAAAPAGPGGAGRQAGRRRSRSTSRRGEVTLYARADDGTPRGAVFVPFCYYEAAINQLTNAGARPVRQDPGVQVLRGPRARPAARPPQQGSYGGGQLLCASARARPRGAATMRRPDAGPDGMEMSCSRPEFWIAVGQIILIDILLGGDNAVVIALACRKLPPKQRTQGILWGTAGAIVLRIILIFFALTLLAIPFLKIVGALLLVWIGVKLLVPGARGRRTATSKAATSCGARSRPSSWPTS